LANKYREIKEEPKQEAPAAKTTAPKSTSTRRKGVVAKSLSSVFSGTFLTHERNMRYIPFLLFVAGLSLFYIAYNYYADDNIRRENKLNREIKECHAEFIATTSEVMFATKQSELAVAALQIGLKEPVTPPVKISVDSAQTASHDTKSE
jgi:hypothetical protein